MVESPPLVRIEPVTFADTLLAVHLNPVEISGLIQVERENPLLYTIRNEPLILEQECNMAHTDFTPAYGRWAQKMMKRGRGEEINKYRLWFHSHPYGDVYFSSTDKETIESWSGALDEWWLSWVLNKRGEMQLRLDVFKPKRMPPIKIVEMNFTESLGKESKEFIRELMIAREARMAEIIRRNVRVVSEPSKPFERMLKGVFGG